MHWPNLYTMDANMPFWIVVALSIIGMMCWTLTIKSECICDKTCVCPNPPSDVGDSRSGIYRISERCPIHNVNPTPHPECGAKVHKNKLHVKLEF